MTAFVGNPLFRQKKPVSHTLPAKTLKRGWAEAAKEVEREASECGVAGKALGARQMEADNGRARLLRGNPFL